MPKSKSDIEAPQPTFIPPISTAETSQTYDGETDPAIVIKLNNQRRVYEQHGLQWPPPVQQIASLESLDPESAEIGGADVTLVVSGTGISSDAKIVFNGGEEATEVISDTQCSTLVKPSLAGAAIDVPVKVRNTIGDSNELMFSFVEAGVRSKSAAKSKEQDDEKNDEKASSKKADKDDDDAAEAKKKGK